MNKTIKSKKVEKCYRCHKRKVRKGSLILCLTCTKELNKIADRCSKYDNNIYGFMDFVGEFDIPEEIIKRVTSTSKSWANTVKMVNDACNEKDK